MASRRSTPATPQRPQQSPAQIEACIRKLERRIGELEAFDPNSVSKRFNVPSVKVLEAAIDEALSSAFGHGTIEYRRYERATRLDHGPLQASFGDYDADNAEEGREYLAQGKEESLALLRRAIASLREELADALPDGPAQSPVERITDKRSVFIVHGHDQGPREAVARFIERIGFEPIILHERPNKGRPLITKLREETKPVGFAIVIMTPDDVGCLGSEAPEELSTRARQNVVFELGFFIGALGPENVAAIVKGEIEPPSDYDGVVYIPFDANNGWQQAIAKELRAAGYAIDWNRVM